MEIDIKFNFLQSNGKISSKRIDEKFLEKTHPDLYDDIIEYAIQIQIQDLPFNQKVYHRIFNLEKVICQTCQKEMPKFLDFKRGYSTNCSSKCSNNSLSVQNKKKKAYLEKYGVDNPSKSKEVINGIQKTFQEKYGANPLSLESVKDQIKKTNLEKYGDEFALGKNSLVRKEIGLQKQKEFQEKYQDLDIIEYSPEKWGDCKIRCNKCQNIYTIPKYNLQVRVFKEKINPCTICNPIGSSLETGIENFIENVLLKNGIEYRKKDRKFLENGKELDFIIDSKKIAIEVNGLYWHSTDYMDKNYHNEKTQICKEKGYKLLHVFEDEVMKTPEIVESRLKSILNLVTNKIYARKCKIREISAKEASEFLLKNHLQGNFISKIRFGLIYDGKLVSLMTFGGLRRSLGASSKEGYWEMVRFANQCNINVIGGASRLLNHFIKKCNPTKIETFCDRRWSDGEFYRKLGFKFVSNSTPNYWWFKTNTYERIHRFSFRKDALIKDGFDPAKTEVEIMLDRGFKRIYDCGSSKWEMNF